VFGRRLLAAALALGTGVLGAAAVTAPPATAAATSKPDAVTLYKEAIATTRSWSVHYASASVQSNSTLLVSGDAGPASGSQTVSEGPGSIDIVVIGGITFLKGNEGGLQNLAGFDASQATAAAGQWIQFATDNSAFSQVVEGVRSQDVAEELSLKGPLSLGHPRRLHGLAVDAIEGRQTVQQQGNRSMLVVLYVRADGSHVPVEEDSVNDKGNPTSAEHVTYSQWGETVRPQAPQPTISIGPVSAV
jgi:hypothetical protein